MSTVKRKKFLNALVRIRNKGDIDFDHGTKHLKVECIRTGECYPIPVNTAEINRHIVRGFKRWLEARGLRGVDELEGLL